VTLSLSPFVRPFVRSLVTKEFFKPKEERKFQGYFKEVTRTFQESFKGVSQKFQGCFKKNSRIL